MGLLAMVDHARKAGADEWRLIGALRDERGIVAGEYNAGQVALACWMLGDKPQLACIMMALGHDTVARVLTAEILPGDVVAARIAVWTDGKVLPEMFAELTERPSPGKPKRTPEAKQPPASGRAADPASPADRPPAFVRVSDTLTLSRGPSAVLLSGADWAVQFDQADLVGLHAGIGSLLAMPTH
jgi:hypothetical protein